MLRGEHIQNYYGHFGQISDEGRKRCDEDDMWNYWWSSKHELCSWSEQFSKVTLLLPHDPISSERDIGRSQYLNLYLSGMHDQINQFIGINQVDLRTDLLSWWKDNAAYYPKIAEIAREVLSIPASTSSSERIFSFSGNIINDRRESMSPQVFRPLTILGSNNWTYFRYLFYECTSIMTLSNSFQIKWMLLWSYSVRYIVLRYLLK